MVPQMAAGLEHYQNLIFYVMLLLVILVWPAGIFGRSTEARGIEHLVPRFVLARLRARTR